MDDLKSLVNLVSKQKIKNLDQVIWTNQNTKFTELYNIVAQEQVNSDEEASILLYGSKSNQAYVKLRKRMFDRLLNTVFFIDAKGLKLTSDQVNSIKVFKNYSLIRILNNRNAKDAAVSLAVKTLKISISLELTEISFLVCKYLRRHFAYISLDNKKFKHYRDLAEKLESEFFSLNRIEKYYDEISNVAISKQNMANRDFPKRLETIVSDVYHIQEKYHSKKIQSAGFQIISFSYLVNKEFEKCISVCNQAKSYFKRKNIRVNFYSYVFNNDKFEALISLGRLAEARQVLEENLELVASNAFNWFKIKRMALSLALFEKDYDEAYIICKEVVLNENFKKFNTINEQWKIRITYIQILVQAGYIDPELVANNPLPKINRNDTLKTMPLYSKDKRGLNITIIVAQLIFLIINKKSIDILDRIDALNRYCSRYLKNNEDLRSNCFLKMISKLPEADFHPIRVERYVEKYKKRLLGTERILSQEISSTEIIAYEVLWDIILDYIGKNR